jgi:DNA modification methylase
MSNLSIEYVPCGKLKLNPKNPRKNDENVAAVVKSMEAFGWTNPILARRANNMVIAGHTRLKAAIEKGVKKVPVVYLDLDEADADVYMIADNKLTENTEWDFPALADLLVEFDQMNVDLGLTGFSMDEIEDIAPATFGPPERDDDDVIPESPPPVCKTGDLWILGNHRLLCGDCTLGSNLVRLVDNLSDLRLILTSPPYFNAREYAHWDTIDAYLSDMKKAVSALASKTKNLCVAWNIGEQAVLRLDLSSKTSIAFDGLDGLLFRDKLCWVKPRAAFDIPRNGHISKGYYYPAFSWEPILVFTKGKHPKVEAKHIAELVADCTDTWHIETVMSQNESKGFHCAAFPCGLAEKGIKCYSPKDTSVYDPFLGSGTTLIACEKLGRRCYGMEIEPKYCDVIIKRWEDYTGGKAVLHENSP